MPSSVICISAIKCSFFCHLYAGWLCQLDIHPQVNASCVCVCMISFIQIHAAWNKLQKIQSTILVFIICVVLSIIINAQSNSAISFSFGSGSTLRFHWGLQACNNIYCILMGGKKSWGLTLQHQKSIILTWQWNRTFNNCECLTVEEICQVLMTRS